MTRSSATRTRGATLTPDAIVDAALELAEQEGAAALSLRKLGERLGVDATAVYRHFREKDDIVLAAFDRIIGTQVAQLPAWADLDWRSRLTRLAENTWETASRYPAMFALAFSRTTGGPAERQIVEFILSTLGSTGLPDKQVVLFYRMYVDAQLALSGMTATLNSLGPALREKDAGAWSRIYAVLPEAEYPAARSRAGELGQVQERDVFLGVITSVLDAVATALVART